MGGLEENNSTEPEGQQASITYSSPVKKMVAVASISVGVQFGWALQLSLLTPYVQLLGIPHKWASYIWLCGPVSGMTVQPIVGYYSDKCCSRWGKRRPFLAVGLFLVLLAILLISFAADLGKLLGDDIHSARAKPRAIIFFVTGFWVLDVGNNTLQGPCRAFLADLAGKNEQRTRNANALFSFFLAVGNVLGYAAGSFNHLYKFLPFTSTKACDIDCANLKTCFFLSALLLLTLTILALTYVQEKPLVGHHNPLSKQNEDEERMENEVEPKLVASIADIGNAIQSLPQSMWVLLLVTCLNWVAWFPFLLYDTDWMGREVYGGEVGVGKRYQSGVRVGALGLMLNSVILGFTSLGLEFLTQKAGGVKQLWGYVNFLLALCLGFMVLISKLAEALRSGDKGHYPSLGIQISSLALFTVLGVPFAVTLILPWALASTFSNSSKAGQGLAIGILNLSICIPQIVISFTSGPWDALFGGGNLPAFVVGAIAAVASGIVALTMLPSLHPE